MTNSVYLQRSMPSFHCVFPVTEQAFSEELDTENDYLYLPASKHALVPERVSGHQADLLVLGRIRY